MSPHPLYGLWDFKKFLAIPPPFWKTWNMIFIFWFAQEISRSRSLYRGVQEKFFCTNIKVKIFILLHIFHIFLHISSYLLHQGIPECDVIRGAGWWGDWCTRESWNYPVGPELEIFSSPPDIFPNGHSSECDVIRGERWEVYTRILELPRRSIRHETCQNKDHISCISSLASSPLSECPMLSMFLPVFFRSFRHGFDSFKGGGRLMTC